MLSETKQLSFLAETYYQSSASHLKKQTFRTPSSFFEVFQNLVIFIINSFSVLLKNSRDNRMPVLSALLHRYYFTNHTTVWVYSKFITIRVISLRMLKEYFQISVMYLMKYSTPQSKHVELVYSLVARVVFVLWFYLGYILYLFNLNTVYIRDNLQKILY